jgi:hypothetical protein
MVWSIYRHQELYDDQTLALFNGHPGRPGRLVSRPDRDIRDYYLHFLETGDLPGFGFEPFWPHVAGWWSVRRLPNVLLVHYANLKSNLGGEIRRIADFLEIEIDAATFSAVVEHSTFDYMRDNCAPENRLVFNKGVNGRWKDILRPIAPTGSPPGSCPNSAGGGPLHQPGGGLFGAPASRRLFFAYSTLAVLVQSYRHPQKINLRRKGPAGRRRTG